MTDPSGPRAARGVTAVLQVGAVVTGADLADAPRGSAVTVVKETWMVDVEPSGAMVRTALGWRGDGQDGQPQGLAADARFRVLWIPQVLQADADA